MVALKNVRDKKQFMYLAKQVYSEEGLGLYIAYLDATQRPHGYLFLDVTRDTDDVLRFRNMFPVKYPLVVYPDIGGGACEIDLPRPSSAQNSRTEVTYSRYNQL